MCYINIETLVLKIEIKREPYRFKLLRKQTGHNRHQLFSQSYEIEGTIIFFSYLCAISKISRDGTWRVHSHKYNRV